MKYLVTLVDKRYGQVIVEANNEKEAMGKAENGVCDIDIKETDEYWEAIKVIEVMEVKK